MFRETVAVIIGEANGYIRMVRVHPNTRLAKRYLEKELVGSMAEWSFIVQDGDLIYQHKAEDKRFSICVRLINDE